VSPLSKILTLGLGLSLGTLLGGCGNPVDCGDGTQSSSGTCKATLPVECGAETVLRNGQCVRAEGGFTTCDPGTAGQVPAGGPCYGFVAQVKGNVGTVRLFALSSPVGLGALGDAYLNDDYSAAKSTHIALYMLQQIDDTHGFLVGGPAVKVAGQLSSNIDPATAMAVPVVKSSDGLTWETAPGVTTTLWVRAFGNNPPRPPLRVYDASFSKITLTADDPNDPDDDYPTISSLRFSGSIDKGQADLLLLRDTGQPIGEFIQQGGFVGTAVDQDGKFITWTLAAQLDLEAALGF
jgi:hypothetical protein